MKKHPKVRLPKNVSIYTDGSYDFYLVYEKDIYYWFPTISELKEIEKLLKNTIKKFPKGRCVEKEAEIFLSGDGDYLGFGIEFSCEYEDTIDFKEAKYHLKEWD